MIKAVELCSLFDKHLQVTNTVAASSTYTSTQMCTLYFSSTHTIWVYCAWLFEISTGLLVYWVLSCRWTCHINHTCQLSNTFLLYISFCESDLFQSFVSFSHTFMISVLNRHQVMMTACQLQVVPFTTRLKVRCWNDFRAHFVVPVFLLKAPLLAVLKRCIFIIYLRKYTCL